MIGQHRPIRRLPAIAALTLLLGGAIVSTPLVALQRDPIEQETLRDRVRQRFTVAERDNGLVLIPLPKRQIGDVRIIEIVDGAISINTEVVSGRELRDRLGENADLVLQISYLDEQGRRDLLESTESVAPPTTGPPRLGPPGAPPTPEPPFRGRSRRFPGPSDGRNSGDIVRIGGNARVAADEVVFGDVVVIGGRSEVDGEVRGNVVTIGGAMRLGPRADVRGDAVAIWSHLDRAPGARVGGEFVDIGTGVWIGPGNLAFPSGGFPRFPSFMGLMATLLRLGLLMMLGWLFVAVGRGPVQRIADRAAAEPVKSGLVGVLAQVLFLPILVVVIVLLAISIIGIPLLALVPLALLALVLVLIAGFTAMAMRVGQWIGSLGSNQPEAYTAVAIGTIVLLSFAVMAKLAFLAGGFVAGFGIVLAFIAFCIEYLVWTVGLGAAVLVRLAPRAQPSDMLVSP